MSVYASWYKQSYPDQVLSLSAMSNDGLVSVDNAGTVRIWETGVANLEKSLAAWRQMIGDLDNRDLMIKRDNVGDLDSPKHGKLDPNNAPHIGKLRDTCLKKIGSVHSTVIFNFTKK